MPEFIITSELFFSGLSKSGILHRIDDCSGIIAGGPQRRGGGLAVHVCSEILLAAADSSAIQTLSCVTSCHGSCLLESSSDFTPRSLAKTHAKWLPRCTAPINLEHTTTIMHRVIRPTTRIVPLSTITMRHAATLPLRLRNSIIPADWNHPHPFSRVYRWSLSSRPMGRSSVRISLR